MKTNFLLGFMAALALVLPVNLTAKSGSRVNLRPSKEIVTERRTSAMNFHAMEVSRLVKLTVEDRTDNIIVVRANENLMPYIELSVSNGCLSATIDSNVNISMSRFSECVVEVFIPNNGRISSVEVYGAAGVNMIPRQQVAKFSAEVYGASSFSGKVVAEQCDLEVYGASHAKVEFEGGRFDSEVYGASTLDGDVTAVKSHVEVSGASSVTLNGSSTSAIVEVSGASGFKGFDFVTEVCSAEITGASNAKINCMESLSATSSGVSSLTYTGACRLSSVSTSGAGTIQKK